MAVSSPCSVEAAAAGVFAAGRRSWGKEHDHVSTAQNTNMGQLSLMDVLASNSELAYRVLRIMSACRQYFDTVQQPSMMLKREWSLDPGSVTAANPGSRASTNEGEGNATTRTSGNKNALWQRVCARHSRVHPKSRQSSTSASRGCLWEGC